MKHYLLNDCDNEYIFINLEKLLQLTYDIHEISKEGKISKLVSIKILNVGDKEYNCMYLNVPLLDDEILNKEIKKFLDLLVKDGSRLSTSQFLSNLELYKNE